MKRLSGILFLCAIAAGGVARAQSPADIKGILDRLQKLEQDNRELKDEVQALRGELAASRGGATASVASNTAPAAAAPALPDQVAVNTSRVDEMAQTKVETSQKMPLRVAGMALFNAYLNGRNNAGAENTPVASVGAGDATGGGSLRQTIVGLEFESPKTVMGAKVTGSLYTDFFAGSANSLDHIWRLRTATVSLDWGSTAITVGQDKPIISPRDPSSFAQVGVSPLTGAGNLWLWQPEAKIEQRVHFGANAGLTAQVGMFQTRELGSEDSGYNPYLAPPSTTLPVERPDPGIEGRFELWRQWGENTRIAIAPGFHTNQSHVGTNSIPSQIFSLDWSIKPARFLEVSGFFYNGQNVEDLGALPQGFVVNSAGLAHVVHSMGGWGQIRIPVTQRLAFDFYGGTQDDRRSDLGYGYIGINRGYFANTEYRIAPNVILSLEGGQVRTVYLGPGHRLNNHYDLAVAYLF